MRESPAVNIANSIEIHGALDPAAERILSPAALEFVANLVRAHRPRLTKLLAARRDAARRRDAGERLDFLSETANVRAGDWRVAPIPPALMRRIVEITGPVDRKMIINALNSGADVFMADLEDASSPSFHNLVDGQSNLFDAVRRTISFEDTARGKRYALADETATLLVRPRGLHTNGQDNG